MLRPITGLLTGTDELRPPLLRPGSVWEGEPRRCCRMNGWRRILPRRMWH